MNGKYNESVPPMRKENEADYKKAMARMARLGHSLETHKDIISYMEREIEKYRSDIQYLKKELKEKTKEVTLETGVAIDGIAVDDRIFRISNGDTMIITSQVRYTKESIDEFVGKFAKCGVGCIVLAPGMDAIGVIEHEKTD